MNIYVYLWCVLLVIVISLALYRRLSSRTEHTVIHVRSSEFSLVPEQMAYAQKVDRIDRLGKTLTAILFVYGLFLVLAFAYARLSS